MSLQLGLIVLPSNTEELNKVLAALSKLGVATSAAQIDPPAGKTTKAPAKQVEVEDEPETETLKPVTPDQLKAVMSRVRDELGDENIAELLTAFGATKLKDVDKGDWPALAAAATTMLDGSAAASDEPEDDGFGLDDEGDDGFGLDDDDAGDAPDAETVKVAVQAYAKKHGKEKATAILSKNGLNTVRGLQSADAATLTAIHKLALKL